MFSDSLTQSHEKCSHDLTHACYVTCKLASNCRTGKQARLRKSSGHFPGFLFTGALFSSSLRCLILVHFDIFEPAITNNSVFEAITQLFEFECDAARYALCCSTLLLELTASAVVKLREVPSTISPLLQPLLTIYTIGLNLLNLILWT